MANYKYQAISKSGEKITGLVEAYSELDAMERIKRDCDVVLKVTEVKGKDKKEGFLHVDLGGKKLNTKEFTLMCNQFAIILRAGLPVARAVSLISNKLSDKTLKRLLADVSSDLENGRTLAAGFEEHGEKLLPPTFVETIRAGEQSGTLGDSFANMAGYYERQTKTRGKVKSALSYPLFVLVVGIIVVIVLMAKVVPKFTEMFADMGADLPVPTQILIAVSDFFRNNFLLLLIIIIVLTVAFMLYKHSENGKLSLAKLGLKLPVLGKISTLNAASQFANTMASLLAAGLPLTKCLNITAKVQDNYFISTETGKFAGYIEEGHRLGDCMRDAEVYPDILVDMVNVGEDSGELQGTLATIAEYYDAELESAVSSALAKLEPAILVFMAGFAGFIVIAIYMAMFGMYGAM